MMSPWNVLLLEDPLVLTDRHDPDGTVVASSIAHAVVPIQHLVDDSALVALKWAGRTARVAVADYAARLLSTKKMRLDVGHSRSVLLETLDKTKLSTSRLRHRGRNSSSLTPFLLERTDIWCSNDSALHTFLRVVVYNNKTEHPPTRMEVGTPSAETIQQAVSKLLQSVFQDESATFQSDAVMNHVATAVLQDRLRANLSEMNAVAFVANGAILPRKSGASYAPMASPPAVPFAAPTDSPMNQTMHVDLGPLRRYIRNLPLADQTNGHFNTSTIVSISGLLVPRGVSLIVGGGYHGKSTLLRTIAAGVYNKIPGDGREFSVTVNDAVTVRAEDGRYVNNCNVSCFISNLPTPPGVDLALDTTHFSSGEASGSTSQAANVLEAIEMGASAFLVDEDVSAANFMARDGRMRSLVMDESITPLLYRVNGLFHSHGISSIVVVGGVGDWLDVPNSVILMDKYLCKDATKKANSISKQFSHGHVQYAGRGVVHRLPWDKSGTPIPRRPADSFAQHFDVKNTAISLLDGSDAIAFHRIEHHDHMIDDEEEDDSHIVDMSRCEQLMGKKPQLYGCGLCVLWLLQVSRKYPELGIPALLEKLDCFLDEEGFAGVVGLSKTNDVATDAEMVSSAWKFLIEALGCAYRPRKFEVGQALTRLRGVLLEETPIHDDGSEAAALAEAERKKQELLELWNSRRKNKLLDETD